MEAQKYKRVLIKISGEALGGEKGKDLVYKENLPVEGKEESAPAQAEPSPPDANAKPVD